MSQKIHSWHQMFTTNSYIFENIATTKQTKNDPKFQGQANKNSFWLIILKFAQNHLNTLYYIQLLTTTNKKDTHDKY